MAPVSDPAMAFIDTENQTEALKQSDYFLFCSRGSQCQAPGNAPTQNDFGKPNEHFLKLVPFPY
jgi:hypothetical protein